MLTSPPKSVLSWKPKFILSEKKGLRIYLEFLDTDAAHAITLSHIISVTDSSVPDMPHVGLSVTYEYCVHMI